MILHDLLFWMAALALVYAYVGYPVCLTLLGVFLRRPVPKAPVTPSVSLVISVYNEAKVLPQKLQNAMETDYPEGLLEIAVLSDGSTDGTDAVIQAHAQKDRRITPCLSDQHLGKTPCLNRFVPGLKGDILVFTDANAFYEKTLIRDLVSSFKDPEIGFVTGGTRYTSSEGGVLRDTTGAYTRLEHLIKRLESRIGSCVGADGAVFAIRKGLFRPLRPQDINDLVIPFEIVRDGYRGVFEPRALCREEADQGAGSAFRRQIRITTRTLNAIFRFKGLLDPRAFPLFSFMLASHKLLRFLGPLWMLLLLWVTPGLWKAFGGVYTLALLFQGLFYSAALLGFLRGEKTRQNPVIVAAHMFLLVNTAYLLGWIQALRGETYTSWKPGRASG